MSNIRLYHASTGLLAEQNRRWFHLPDVQWDAAINRDDVQEWLNARISRMAALANAPDAKRLRPTIGSQEVWAAGVTYYRSRTARMEEAKSAGGGDFYDRVYDAERPELFFKATPHRVRGHGEAVRIRGDAKWNVPEPELALVVTSKGTIVGYTIGNDMSSRDIEGENPLYLPQAKVYDGSCALGPAVLLTRDPLPSTTEIRLAIRRDGQEAFTGTTSLSAMKRTPQELVGFLFRDNSFPTGCVLLTGTGVVPPDAFTLKAGDEIAIEIGPIGTLINQVA
jgi:2-dehydro-3-deoxy-D-arabinonate dehydratase